MRRWLLAVGILLSAAIASAHADYIRITYYLNPAKKPENQRPGVPRSPARPGTPGVGPGAGGIPPGPGGGGNMPPAPGGGGNLPGPGMGPGDGGLPSGPGMGPGMGPMQPPTPGGGGRPGR